MADGGNVRFFDDYLMIDWSANNSPKTGADSIWLCHGCWDGEVLDDHWSANPSTRREAVAIVEDLTWRCLGAGRRMLVGLDFSFGLPRGFVAHFGEALGLDTSGPAWETLWSYLAARVVDDDANHSNRFALADEINRRTGHCLFWGRPGGEGPGSLVDLPARSAAPPHLRANPLPKYRLAEVAAGKGIKSTWQLFGGVTVGSQTLLGIPRLEHLRRRFGEQLAVWPFETDLMASPGDPRPPIVLAEIWPTVVPIDMSLGAVKDEAQVRSLVRWCARRDRQGHLGAWLAPRSLLEGAPDRGGERTSSVRTEEGWILGVE